MATPPLAQFYLTDGDEYVNLLSTQNGFVVKDWRPATPEPKGGGVFQSSPLGEGRQLVARYYDNAFENLTLVGHGGTADLLIFESQRIRRLLEKMVNYWTTEWQSTSVYLVARGIGETNLRYALLYDYRAPGDGNPFASPFIGPDAAIFDDWPLLLERGDWTENPPGQSTCVQVSGTGTYTRKAGYKSTVANDDNAYTTDPGTIALGQTNFRFGDTGGNNMDTGIRFRNVDIPSGAVITSAVLRLVAGVSDAGTTVNATIVGEDADNAAAFSTYANFQGRARTSATVAWNSIAAWTVGDVIVTGDLATIIQKIVDRAGWVEGNALVLFIEDNGSSNGTERRPAGLANTTYPEPELIVVFETQTLGRTATCDNEVYVANKQNKANLTDVYYYDASAGAFSVNLMETALPYRLFPNVPAAGDILYLGCDTSLTDSGPFCSAVFDILAAQANITGVAYEIYTGAWNAHTVQDNTASGGIPFSVTGVNAMHWVQPSTWATTAINGVTGYWVRIRITSVGGGPTAPTQQNWQPYSITWANGQIDAAQVGGDLPALATYRFFTQSGTRTVLDDLLVQRLIVGLRSLARGANFVPALNFSDEQNPTGITGAEIASAATSMVTDARAPSGRAVQVNAVGAIGPVQVARIIFSSTSAPTYYGRYRALLRLTVDTGTADDITLTLSFLPISNNLTLEYVYQSVTLPFIDEWLLVDFGQIVLPNTNLLKPDEIYPAFDLVIGVETAQAVNLKLYDLWLIPIDENALDAFSITSSELLSVIKGEYLELDSLSNPKAASAARALHRLVSDESVVSIYQTINAGEIILQANADQIVCALSAIMDVSGATAKQQSFGYSAYTLQAERQQRYLSMRGNR